MTKVYIAGKDTIPGHISLGEGESLSMVILVFPGVSCDIPLVVDLEGRGADANISGLYICGSDEQVNFNIRVNHKSGDTSSRQLFNGVVGGTSRASFDGRINVSHGAEKIKAYQENHNILLSDTAHVETSPQLEIYADDVECSHGATTGFLNAEEQFYMRSRGIPEAEARILQVISFLAPVVARIEGDVEREAVAARVEEAIRSI